MLPSKRRILQNVHTDTENPCKSVGRKIQIRTASISEQQRTEWNRNKGTLFVKLQPRHVARGAESLAFLACEGHISSAQLGILPRRRERVQSVGRQRKLVAALECRLVGQQMHGTIPYATWRLLLNGRSVLLQWSCLSVGF
jgi:hypothetical protein